MRARVGDVHVGGCAAGSPVVIARGGFGLWAGEVDHEDFERELRIEARDRARARCEDHTPRCARCRGRGGFPEYDPEGRPLSGWEPCDMCDGTGLGDGPAPMPITECAAVSSSAVTDFGADDVPF